MAYRSKAATTWPLPHLLPLGSGGPAHPVALVRQRPEESRPLERQGEVKVVVLPHHADVDTRVDEWRKQAVLGLYRSRLGTHSVIHEGLTLGTEVAALQFVGLLLGRDDGLLASFLLLGGEEGDVRLVTGHEATR